MGRRAVWSRLGWKVALGLCLGVAAGLADDAIAGALGFVAAVAVIVLGSVLAMQASILYRLPGRVRAHLTSIVDPDGCAPDGAQPLVLVLVEHWARAINARDWTGARGLLDEEFVVRIPGARRAVNRRLYLKSLRRMARAYPDFCIRVEAVVGERADEDVIWVRVVAEGHPRLGSALDYTAWELWRLDRNRERLLAIESAAVIRVA